MDVSSQMLAFVRVVETGSISAASRASGQTPSAVSKQIGHLEDHVGHRLLRRTRAGVSLTHEGARYYEKCRAMAEKFIEAEDYISSFSDAPSGQLRVASSVAFGKAQLIHVLPEFLATYPEIRFSLELTDRTIEIEEESFDAAISFAEQETDPNVIVRRIMRNERILCAAPSFIERHGMPESFADLARYNCLRTSNARGRNAWQATLDGVNYAVEADGNFEGNSADAVFIAAMSGLGIARLSTYLVAHKIASGELVRLFPEYTQDHADVAVSYAQKRNLSPAIRAFVDFLVDRFDRPQRRPSLHAAG
ncbi:HTH-type transcriptional regulator DmlR [Sulfitobacter sp. THAF37]|uniref:LysR family transcriptional regulator n=1 Tax=Sulfitobacter sp. THAF37 TaxID=2587855 RepID=UPI001268B94C|nr:LysR family transcriptional regulator [Sulfitobacter sp. THAF37]QFT59803.1 HTH-type transcriptional regulator DmlR [Sulfitobacter sp. THAF37]